MSAPNAGHSSAGRANVSVTNINCENTSNVAAIVAVDCSSGAAGDTTNNGAHCSQQSNFYGKGGIRISVPKMEESDESDTELSNIEKTAKVNMRRPVKVGGALPRPMSWEGELSEPDELMDTDTSQSAKTTNGTSESHNEPINATISNKTTILTNSAPEVKPVILQETVKTEAASSYPAEHQHAHHFPSATATAAKKFPPEVMNLKYEPGLLHEQAVNSPLLMRSKTTLLPANPSPDSAIHSVYTHSSPSQSPLTSRHAPYTPSLSRNNSDASHSSCYSYSSEFSPTHSPIQGRHPMYATNSFNGSPLHHSIYRPPIMDGSEGMLRLQTGDDPLLSEGGDHIPSAGISRQQLINSPCPICGDKISGFHYGIFSCESCKGFFKRTVQNRKNYVCIRGALCPVTIATRKKCPACRFDKCLQKGMKLEAIREDRTRGGRSTYQCSYTLPGTILNPSMLSDNNHSLHHSRMMANGGPMLKQEQPDNGGSSSSRPGVPTLLQEIMDVEHLWQYNEAELSRLNQPVAAGSSGSSASSISSNPLLASAGLNGDNSNPDLIANLCNIADHRLYKIVKWCKSLPLFKNISIDDQICLLINSWCELLLFSCCFRSMATPGEIRISLGKSITLAQAKHSGLQACIERMLNLTDHLRRLRVDKYEYVAMKVIVLLSSDTAELKESEKVRASQEKALQALQAYTLSHYPESPAKFGELLLRIPELQRTCQVGKEMLTIKSKEGEEPSFNLLMELLRGEH